MEWTLVKEALFARNIDSSDTRAMHVVVRGSAVEARSLQQGDRSRCDGTRNVAVDRDFDTDGDYKSNHTRTGERRGPIQRSIEAGEAYLDIIDLKTTSSSRSQSQSQTHNS